MPEIGSEFWDVPIGNVPNGLFEEPTRFFLSGRAGLSFIIKDIFARQSVTTAALPSWCCDSMILPFLEAGLEVKFYTVLPCDGGVVQRYEEAEDCDIILDMDYFGYDSSSVARNFRGVVIRDLTHSFFSRNYDDADYYFGSMRKWAGFYTGGFARKANGDFITASSQETDCEYVALRKSAMAKKREYILGNTNSKDYLETFGIAEERLEKTDILGAVPEDVEKMKLMDLQLVKKRRRDNAEYLLKQFSDIAVFPSLSGNECPLFVPILVPDGKRNELRRYLIENEIYCPVHWPLSEYHRITEKAKEIYDNELSLVCDQRYELSDMERVAETIKNFWRE